MLSSSYNLPLVLASLFIATLASYTALDLSGRIFSAAHQQRRGYWLAGGAASLGMGIWCMHFVGMLSFSLPILLGYDMSITIFSLLIAVVVSYFTLLLMSAKQLSAKHLIVSGCLLGAGISSMHYMGMHALQMHPAIQYDPLLFTTSVLVAMIAATAALWIAYRLRAERSGHRYGWHLAAAIVMGMAIAGMHYIGMAAASFPNGAICMAAQDISTHWLALATGGTTFSILCITLILSVLDRRMEARTEEYITSLQNVNEELQYQATHDALTGLPNRVLLFERIQHAIDAAHHGTNLFAIYFIDLDGFKGINDTLGHAAGDAVLKQFAIRLKRSVRKEDIVARLGGDEFVVMVEDIPDVDMAAHIAEKLFSCFHEDFALDYGNLQVTPSMGVALYPEDGQNVDELLSHADAAMYEAKTNGRNGYRFFETSMNEATLRSVEIQRALPAAIAGKQFHLQYQPKFDGKTGEILGAEALLRWHHPQLGTVSPAEFIPIAERSGQIARVGEWVLEEVCRQLRAWDNAGMKTIRIAINLSQVQLRAQRLVEEILSITKRHQISPQMLMFEITETAAMQNAEDTMHTVDRLQQAGFKLAIDDFGTGYSSLSYLQQFGVQQMKVDRSFIRDLTSTAKSRSIVAAIIRLAHSLNMEVVAEGVETSEQLELLRQLECDQTQGYLLAKPMDGSRFIALLNGEEQDRICQALP
jgi:diguanylate cyclase (GGDEF)-like protein